MTTGTSDRKWDKKAIERILADLQTSRTLQDYFQGQVDRYYPDAYRDFIDRMKRIQSLNTLARQTKRGRPRTRVSPAEFTRNRIVDNIRYDLVLLMDALAKGAVNLDDDDLMVTGGDKLLLDIYRICKTGAMVGDTPTARISFFDGAIWMAKIIESVVLKTALFDLQSITKQGTAIKEASELIAEMARDMLERGRVSAAEIEKYKKQARAGLPQDMLRKLAPIDEKRAKLIRFSVCVKEIKGPAYLDELAKMMNVSVDEVLAMQKAASRAKVLASTIEASIDGEFVKITEKDPNIGRQKKRK